jgi:hypothetical protein
MRIAPLTLEHAVDICTWSYPEPAFRVTVASFNARALRVVQSLGFAPVAEFEASTPSGGSYQVLVRDEGLRASGHEGSPYG